MKNLLLTILISTIIGMILSVILNIIPCIFITHVAFKYSIYNNIIQPLVFATVITIVLHYIKIGD